MATAQTAKPAAALSSEPAPSVVGSGGLFNIEKDTRDRTFVQALRLTRLYAISYETAVTIAALAYGVAR